jgi:hypothetical protein
MSPNVYSNPAAAAKFSGKQRDLKSQIESLESDWLEQQEKLNALQP